MTFVGVVTLDRKFKESMVATITVDQHQLIPLDGEYQVLVVGMSRKLVISSGVIQLYLYADDKVVFGSPIEITLL